MRTDGADGKCHIGCPGGWNIHVQQRLKDPCAVNAGGIGDGRGNAFVCSPKQQQAHGGGKEGNHHAQQRIQQAQLAKRCVVGQNQHIRRNDDLHHNQRHGQAFSAKIDARQGIGPHRYRNQLHRQNAGHDQEGVQSVLQKRRRVKYNLKVFQRKCAGQLQQHGFLGRLQRRKHRPDQRNGPQQAHHKQHGACCDTRLLLHCFAPPVSCRSGCDGPYRHTAQRIPAA